MGEYIRSREGSKGGGQGALGTLERLNAKLLGNGWE